MIGAGYTDKVVLSANFNAALGARELKFGSTEVRYSPECYELACLLPSGTIDVIDASELTLEACSKLPCTDYFGPYGFVHQDEVVDRLKDGDSSLRAVGEVPIRHKIKSLLKWTPSGLDLNSIPVGDGLYDFVLASKVLTYPLEKWLQTQQRGYADEATRQSGVLVIGNLIQKLKMGVILAVDYGTCFSIADLSLENINLLYSFVSKIRDLYSVKVQLLENDDRRNSGSSSEFLLFTRQ